MEEGPESVPCAPRVAFLGPLTATPSVTIRRLRLAERSVGLDRSTVCRRTGAEQLSLAMTIEQQTGCLSLPMGKDRWHFRNAPLFKCP